MHEAIVWVTAMIISTHSVGLGAPGYCSLMVESLVTVVN